MHICLFPSETGWFHVPFFEIMTNIKSSGIALRSKIQWFLVSEKFSTHNTTWAALTRQMEQIAVEQDYEHHLRKNQVR